MHRKSTRKELQDNKMLKRKRIREKGKIKFNRYFQELNKGDKVAVIKELSLKSAFPKTIQGRVGIIEEKRGNCYVIKIKLGKEKRYIIHPINLKKLKS